MKNADNSQIQWTATWKFWFRFKAVFVMMFILTLSFPHPHIPDVSGLIAPVFSTIVSWIGTSILGLTQAFASELISDSTGLYIHVFVLLFLSLVVAAAWGFFDRKPRTYREYSYWFRVIICYYLAFYFLVYGFNKVFKWQFYMPEPNTLFTTMGNTYRDLLYWSSMGTSHSYNLFLGGMEILAAGLLLFRKTRLVGGFLSFMIMVNVVMVNFSFDISVKIYSCFLLLLSLLIIAPEAGSLYRFFVKQEPAKPVSYAPLFTKNFRFPVYYVIKPIMIGYMLWSSLTVYLRTGNFNDDAAKRPIFHGAYEIPLFVMNNDTLLPLKTDTDRWQRLFIHRRGYLIVQGMCDGMKDFQFEADTLASKWKIIDERNGHHTSFSYEKDGENVIYLKGRVGKDSLWMQLKKIDLDKLPVMQKEFNWTVD